MFLNRASVRRHIAGSKPCRDAKMDIREILLEARAGDVMAGGGATRYVTGAKKCTRIFFTYMLEYRSSWCSIRSYTPIRVCSDEAPGWSI